jgi:glycosyltransferase involved in cell wall biosynthesis
VSVARRIGLLHWSTPPSVGGSESHLADLAGLLLRRDRQVTVITGEPAPLLPDGCAVVTIELLHPAWLLAAQSDLARLARDVQEVLDATLERNRLDVVHAHNLNQLVSAPTQALEALRATRRLRVHHTFHSHLPWPSSARPDLNLYAGWAGNYAVSEFVRQALQREGLDTVLLRSGVDTAVFHSDRPCLSEQAPSVIFHPARLLPHKGAIVSVRMLAKLTATGLNARLVLADSPVEDWDGVATGFRARIINLARRLGVARRVELRAIPYRDMPAAYAAADVVVYPTLGQEPLGLAPIEAMSCARPVVASRVGGIPETVIDGETGWLVPAGDAQALADRVARLLTLPGLAQAMGRRGRAQVIRHHDVDTMVTALLARYDDAGRCPARP